MSCSNPKRLSGGKFLQISWYFLHRAESNRAEAKHGLKGITFYSDP